jgi:hypothetical protein
MATITVIEKNKFSVEDFNGTVIGDRIMGVANVLLDDYYNGVGIDLDATALGLDGLIAVFIQSTDANIGLSAAVTFDYVVSRGLLLAYADGTECADGDLDGMYARVLFLGY